MREIDEYFADKPDRTLFHYTGIEALLGIASTSSLWASNAYYLSDSEEIVYACNVFDRVVEGYSMADNRSAEEKEFLAFFKSWISSLKTANYNIFVFSLSEESSLLSQWRSYTPHGKGVSIGFSAILLRTIMTNSSLRLAKCLYERSEQETLIHSLITKMLLTFNQDKIYFSASPAHEFPKYQKYLEKFRGDVLQVLSVIKHNAFSEEKEWRLISPYFPNYTVDTIKFRQGASMLVPYLELKLGENKPYFETVILGPSQHQHLSFSALSMFLSNQGLCNQTQNSLLPYREW